jgi:DNA topoisomerase-1
LVQIGVAENEGDEKPQFASLRTGQRLETITLEEALDLFKLPRNVGKYEEEDVIISIGRFGPYARHKSAFYSLKKEDDPYTITLERAIQLIEDKRKADRERLIKTFKENTEIQVLNGRWGPYIAHGKENAKVPKDRDPKSLTLAECLELLENKPPSKGRFAKKVEIRKEKTTAKKRSPAQVPSKKTATKSPAKKAVVKSPTKKSATKKGTKKVSSKKK